MAPGRTTPTPTSDETKDLAGRVALVSGGTAGIGARVAAGLAARGAKVYITGRSARAGDALVAAGAAAVFLRVDLATVQGAKAGAAAFLACGEERLDILVNSAALLAKEYAFGPEGPDGLVDSMGVNHLGHFVFTTALLPLLERTAALPGSDVRIVAIGSEAYKYAPKNTRFNSRAAWNARCGGDSVSGQMARYGISKLANLLFIRALQARVSANITCLLTHPGAVYTEGVQDRLARLPQPISAISKGALSLMFYSPEQGARTTLFAAAAPEIAAGREAFRGAYVCPSGLRGRPKVVRPSGPLANSDELAEELWEASEMFAEEMSGEKLSEKA